MTADKPNPPFLLVAPPGVGKTHFCLEKIRATFQQSPFAPVWLIVRDRLQAAAYRKRLQQAGLALGVEVATFGDVFETVLTQSGSAIPVAEEPALRGLVRAVVDEVDGSGGLVHFNRLRQSPGFLSVLSERFAEMKRSLIWPDQLIATAQARQDAVLLEIGRLYATYQQRLNELGWADQEGVTWLGLEALRTNPALLRHLRLVIVDGFEAFNPAQRQTLQALAGRVHELWITLPGDPTMTRPAHRRFARTLRELREVMPLEIISLPAAFGRPEEFANLEARLFEPPKPPLTASPRITLLETQSPDDEAREALRWLKARIVRDGVSPEDCALIVPDYATYRTAILAAGAEFGLPLRLTQTGRLIDTPPITALLDLLFLPLKNFPLRLLLDTVRAPFFDFSVNGLRREDAKTLEIVSRFGQIFEGLEPWHEVLGELAASSASEGAVKETSASEDGKPDEQSAAVIEAYESEEASVPILPKGESASRLDSALQSMAQRILPPAGDQPLADWVRWLVDLLESLRFAKQMRGSVELHWLKSFRAMLIALGRSDRLSGSRIRSYAAFLQEFQALLAGTPAADDLPAADNPLLVLHTAEARGLRFRVAALVGLAEGIFPSVERADPFLSEAVRAELGIEPRLGQDQAGIFYQMIARAEDRLLLTRPYLAKDGESWEPSPFWLAAQEVLGKRAMRVRPEDNRPLCEAASPEELIFWAARQSVITGKPLEAPYARQLQSRYHDVARAQHVLAARANSTDTDPHLGSLRTVSGMLSERFGAQAVWSASRLESYATCPFAFFAGSALGLEQIRPPKAGFESFQLGSLLHEVLEHVYRDSRDPADVNAVLEILPEVAARVFAEAPRKYTFRPSLLWEVQKAELLETLRATIVGLAELDTGAGWRPEAFECRFGIGDDPFLEIPVDGQAVRLRGVIDRVDRDRNGNLRVIDYKSGSAHLAAQDLLEGRRLQLPLYALAVEQALGLGTVTEGLYWKLFAQEPGSLRLGRFDCELGSGPGAACELAVRHIERLVGGIRAGEFAPQPPDGGCPSYCPAASWCWSYRARPIF